MQGIDRESLKIVISEDINPFAKTSGTYML